MRKIIQLCALGDRELYALCADGTTWSWNHEGQWKQWPPPIPFDKNLRGPDHKKKIQPARGVDDGEIKL